MDPTSISSGVLLVNLGSPDAPTTPAVRRYLREFLSDPNVVDVPRIIWWPLLRGIILPFRAPKSAALYQRVWTDAGSPLIALSREQQCALQERVGPDVPVGLGMRYGNPSIREALVSLREQGCSRVVLLTMFPQYARATVGTAIEKVEQELSRLHWTPDLHVVPPYFEHPGYIAALAAGVRRTLAQAPADHLVFSFHGLPQKQVDRGDPYQRHCEASARALAAALQLDADAWTLVYQSRFGPQPWLQPYADERVPELAATHARIAVACPGFTADCIETLDEIGELLRATFLEAGGEDLRLVPCLNADDAWIDAMHALVEPLLRAPA